MSVSAFVLTVLMQFCMVNAQKTLTVRFEAGGIAGSKACFLKFINLEIMRVVVLGMEFIYRAYESERNVPVTLRLAHCSDTRLEHEWKMFKHLGAAIELENYEELFGDAAKAGLPRVYGFGEVITADVESVCGFKVLVTEPIVSRPFEEMFESGDLEKNDEARYTIVLQMLMTLAYLHSKSVRHGNFAPPSFAQAFSGDNRICLIRIYTAEICDEGGHLTKDQTHHVSASEFHGLNMHDPMENCGTNGPQIRDDHESTAYIILRTLGISLGWSEDSQKLFKIQQDHLNNKRLDDSKVKEKYNNRLKIVETIANKQIKMTKRIHTAVLKGNKQYEIVLEMIESARPACLLSYIEGYAYKVTGLGIRDTEALFISLWESTKLSVKTSESEAPNSSGGTFSCFGRKPGSSNSDRDRLIDN